MRPEEIAELIEAGIPSSKASVLSEDNTHFSAVVVAAEFNGLRTLKRHQLIYETLGSRVGNEIHALSIRAFTPDEWAAQDAAGG